MKSFSINYLLAVLLLLFGCSQDKTKVVEDVRILDLEDVEKLSDTNLITDIEYIPLSSKGDHFIGEVCRVIFKNNMFYIFDFLVNNSVMVFNDSGGFEYEISKTGNGPGEYVSVSDFEVDDSGNIYMMDAGGQKMICYSDRGQSFKVIRLPKFFIEFAFAKNNKMVAYRPFSSSGLEDCYGIVDLNENKYETIFPLRDFIDEHGTFKELSHIFSSGGDLWFSPRLSNRIYSFRDDKAIERYRFKDGLLPEKIDEGLLNEYGSIRQSPEYISSIKGIFETDNTVMISYQMRYVENLLVSKNTDKLCLLRDILPAEMPGKHRIIGSDGDVFISVVNKLRVEDIEALNLSDKDKKRFQDYDYNSNPVIALFKVRKF
ncbi:6-bladed beta-propeller [Puteibacter caeruleilacunae]|nr:6-bladed beta-propeller [Puteibacter caeruleilacunae]